MIKILKEEFDSDRENKIIDAMIRGMDIHYGKHDEKGETSMYKSKLVDLMNNMGIDTTSIDRDEFDRLWEEADRRRYKKIYGHSYYEDDDDSSIEISGITFYDSSDAKDWLDDAISEYGNTRFFPDHERMILNKLINKFGDTRFWNK